MLVADDIDEEEEAEMQNPNGNICPPALLNNVILRNIFRFVDFTTLEKCRLVCSKWRLVCEPDFRKQSRILCDDKKEDCNFNFLKGLLSEEDSEMPFTSLTLHGNLMWKAAEVEEFFRFEGRVITDLQLENLKLLDVSGNPCPNIDVTTFISPNLKRLSIRERIYADEEVPFDYQLPVSVSLDALMSVDYLSLSWCKIILKKDVRISPIEIATLNFNEYFLNGTEIENVSLREYFDFGRLEKLSVNDTDGNISLDLQGSISLKTVELGADTNLVNWETSEWKVNRMKLEGIHFLQRTQMHIVELELWSCKVDLSVLPRTINTLILVECEEIRCSASVCMYQLKCLQSVRNRNLDFLSHFQNCDNITELRVYNDPNEATKINLNVDSFPKNISKLFLFCDNQLVGNRVIELDTFVLAGSRPNDINDFEFVQIHPKHLIFLKDEYPFKLNDECIRKIIQLSQDTFDTVTAGLFHWNNGNEFAESYVFNFVDRKAEYYTFKDGRGEAIGSKVICEKVGVLTDSIDHDLIEWWDFPSECFP